MFKYFKYFRLKGDEKAIKAHNLNSMKILLFHLGLLNLWPKHDDGDGKLIWRMHVTYGHIFHALPCWVTGVLYIVNNIRILSFFEIGHSYITSMLYVVFISRLPLPLFQRYKDLCSDFVHNIHLFNRRHTSAYAMETYNRIQKITHILVVYVFFLTWGGTTLFSIMSICKNIFLGNYNFGEENGNSTKRLIYSIYLELPFDVDNSLTNHIVLNIYNWCVGCSTMTGVLFGDVFMCIIVMHLWGRFKIFIHELDNFPRPKADTNPENSYRTLPYYAEMFSESEIPMVNEKLKQYISTHFELSTFVDNMSTTFGPILFVYNGFHLAACCLLLLECSVMNVQALITYLPLTSVIFHNMMVLSGILELLGTVSEKVMEAVYNLPWEAMDKNSRLTVIIFLTKVQEPVRVKALGMVTIGVTNMAAILKTSFSYFAFLRTMAD